MCPLSSLLTLHPVATYPSHHRTCHTTVLNQSPPFGLNPLFLGQRPKENPSISASDHVEHSPSCEVSSQRKRFGGLINRTEGCRGGQNQVIRSTPPTFHQLTSSPSPGLIWNRDSRPGRLIDPTCAARTSLNDMCHMSPTAQVVMMLTNRPRTWAVGDI
jgi:hypothetical protein